MKKTRKEVDDSEIKYLTENPLSPSELATIRKLNGATSVPGSQYSKRTIEAVLQGRRNNPRILQKAIHSAVEELERYTTIMHDLLNKLRSPTK
jgi:hypothetical protein